MGSRTALPARYFLHDLVTGGTPHNGSLHWVFIGRTDAETETPIIWPPHAKSWLVGKDPDAGRSWGQEEKGTTEDEMAGWHHRLDGHEFEWTPGVGMDREAWRATVHGVAKSWTRLSGWTDYGLLQLWSRGLRRVGQRLAFKQSGPCQVSWFNPPSAHIPFHSFKETK